MIYKREDYVSRDKSVCAMNLLLNKRIYNTKEGCKIQQYKKEFYVRLKTIIIIDGLEGKSDLAELQ